MHPNDGRAVSNFIIQALAEKDITVYGDGLQTRSFCYVDDLIEGIIKTMETRDDFTGPMNLGNPQEITILELVETIIKLTNSKSKIIFKKALDDEPRKRQPDISLAKKEINWNPKIDLEDGLDRTIWYFKALLKT